MIEVKLSFSTAEELVSFFTQAQVQTIPAPLATSTPQAEYKTDLPPAAGEKAEDPLPEEPALRKTNKPGRKPKDTTSTQAGSGANNPGSNGSAPAQSHTPAEAKAVQTAGVEGESLNPVETPAADVKSLTGADIREAVAQVKKQYTIDDARQALTRLNDEQGIDAVRTLLAQLGASRISELPVDKYPELMAACPAALKAE